MEAAFASRLMTRWRRKLETYANLGVSKTPVDRAELACNRRRMDDRPTLYDVLMSIKPEGLSVNAWASRAQVSRSFFADLKRRGVQPRTDTIARVVAAAGYTMAQFHNLLAQESLPAPPPAKNCNVLPFRSRGEPLDVPLLGTAQGSDLQVQSDGQVIFVERMD